MSEYSSVEGRPAKIAEEGLGGTGPRLSRRAIAASSAIWSNASSPRKYDARAFRSLEIERVLRLILVVLAFIKPIVDGIGVKTRITSEVDRPVRCWRAQRASMWAGRGVKGRPEDRIGFLFRDRFDIDAHTARDRDLLCAQNSIAHKNAVP